MCTKLKNNSAQRDLKVLPSETVEYEPQNGHCGKEPLPIRESANSDHLTPLDSETHDKLPGQPLYKS